VKAMEKLFFTVLNMSITASVVIVAVLLARLALRDAPKVFSYTLWAAVLLRLLSPVSIESRFALISNYAVLQPVSLHDIQILTGVWTHSTGRSTYNAGYAGFEPFGNFAPFQEQEIPPAPEPANWPLIISCVWLAGVVIVLGHSIWSLAKLRRKLVCSMPLKGESDVRLVDHIPSPFVLGVLSPKIYLPSDLSEGELDYILLHERTHIRRMDHISRALAWLALAVHWFNPLVWLAFRLAGKDMEMSCDEAVLHKMGRDVRTDYSTSLLRLSAGGKLPAGPLAFGSGYIKGRIKNVLRYSTPALRVSVLAFVAVLTIGTALATSPGRFIDPDSITAVTEISATSSLSPRGTIVYTAADRRQDLLDPELHREVRKEDSDKLIQLINSSHKTLYGRGELELNGEEHHLFRLSCADGGYYLVDHWYWNGFSVNPLHFGEDSFTTLVTRYDSDGRAGTTWQLEYCFDKAYKNWRDTVIYNHGENFSCISPSSYKGYWR